MKSYTRIQEHKQEVEIAPIKTDCFGLLHKYKVIIDVAI